MQIYTSICREGFRLAKSNTFFREYEMCCLFPQGVVGLEKSCKCGRKMNIRLRTVIYQNKVEIDNVPIFSCETCSHSEVYPGVKPELTGLIAELGAVTEK